MAATIFETKQFRAGNSQAVRIPSDMAFPPKTELVIKKEGNKITIEPKEKSIAQLPLLFAALSPFHDGKRQELEANEREWE